MTQVTLDENRYLACVSHGGLLDGGIEIDDTFWDLIETEKMRAYYLENGVPIFDSRRWAEIEVERGAPLPTAEERIAELETALHILLKGEVT